MMLVYTPAEIYIGRLEPGVGESFSGAVLSL